MKLLSSLLLSSIIFLGSDINPDKDQSYYFLEAQCEECAIESDGFKLNFYVITEAIEHANGSIDVDALTEEFKKTLSEKFENEEALLENIVVRTSASEKKLSRLKNNYREKYLKKGYHVKILK